MSDPYEDGECQRGLARPEHRSQSICTVFEYRNLRLVSFDKQPDRQRVATDQRPYYRAHYCHESDQIEMTYFSLKEISLSITPKSRKIFDIVPEYVRLFAPEE